MSIELAIILTALIVAHLIHYSYLILSHYALEDALRRRDARIEEMLIDCMKMDEKMQAVYNRELDRMQVKLKEKEKP